jgi:uncharacterized membrane protein
MATLSVLKFNDPYGAERVMIALQGMQEREMITLEDAAVVSWPEGNKKPKTHQLHSTAGMGAMSGAFWGFLFGLIFFVPFLGAAIGASMGGLSGSLADVGISDDFIKQVREKVTEGTSALFALTSGATAPDKVVDELKHTTSRSSRPTCQRSRSRSCARPSRRDNGGEFVLERPAGCPLQAGGCRLAQTHDTLTR